MHKFNYIFVVTNRLIKNTIVKQKYSKIESNDFMELSIISGELVYNSLILVDIQNLVLLSIFSKNQNCFFTLYFYSIFQTKIL